MRQQSHQGAVVAACSQFPNNDAPSYGSYSSFGFNTDTATIGQLFMLPATCTAPIRRFFIGWPVTNPTGFPGGRGYVYEFDPVTRQVVGSPLVDTPAAFFGNAVTVSFASMQLQPATQYALIVTTSGSWNGGTQLTQVVDTVPLSVPLGGYPGALQGAITLNSGNNLALVSSGAYTLQPFNFHMVLSLN